MINFWTSLKKHKKMVLFLNIIFIIGLIVGFVYFYYVKDEIIVNIKDDIIHTSFSSNIKYHIAFLSLILFFNLLLLGPFLGVFLFFYEAFSIGFIFAVFFSFGGVSGFIYAMVYILIFKLLYVILLDFILIKSFLFLKNYVGYFLLKKDSMLKTYASKNYLSVFKYSVSVIFVDSLVELLGNSILGMFSFLI